MFYCIFVHMRQGIAILFSFLMLSISCVDLLQIVAFKLNQGSITALFCVNKDKPAMKCDGKCFLKKALTTSKDENQSKPIPPPNEKSTIVYIQNSFNLSSALMALKSNTFFNYLEPFTLRLARDILHPPERWM